MKCRCQRARFGCISHFLISGVLCAERLSNTTCTSRARGTCRSINLKERQHVAAGVPFAGVVDHLPGRGHSTPRTGRSCRCVCSRGSSSLPGPGSSATTAECGSNPWHWVFSSKLNTTVRCGASTYSPTTSTSFSSNCGSVEILNVATFHGFSSWSRQIRATVSFRFRDASPSSRVVQCVDPSSGDSCNVSYTTAATVPLRQPRLTAPPRKRSAQHHQPPAQQTDDATPARRIGSLGIRRATSLVRHPIRGQQQTPSPAPPDGAATTTNGPSPPTQTRCSPDIGKGSAIKMAVGTICRGLLGTAVGHSL